MLIGRLFRLRPRKARTSLVKFATALSPSPGTVHRTARHWFSVRATSGARSCQFGRTSAGQPTSQVATRRQTRPETTPRFVAARSSKCRTKYRFLRSNVFPAVVRFPCETRSLDPGPCRAHFRPEPSPEMESRGYAVFVMIGLGRGSSVIVPNWRSLH
jgi:hypothetical protein